MKICTFCGSSISDDQIKGGVCADCRSISARAPEKLSAGSFRPPERAEDANRHVIVTTAMEVPKREVAEILQVIGAEAALGLNIFKDIANNWRDVIGGRSATVQKAVKDARSACMADLRNEAAAIGADAVIAVRLDFSEMSTAGSGGILLVTAIGTAVRLKEAT